MLRSRADRMLSCSRPSSVRINSGRGGRDVAARKPFVAIQRVQLPPGKGQPASRKRVLHVAVATPSLKRRQQVLKPRGSPDMSNAEAFVLTAAGAASTRPALARERRFGRGLGPG